MQPPTKTTTAILGAGPIALDAALALHQANRPFVILEQGPHPASNIRAWGSVRLFTPWSMNLSSRMRAVLAAIGQPAPDGDHCPTGNTLCDLALDKIAQSPAIAPHLFTHTRVIAVGREGLLKREEIGTAQRAKPLFRLLIETNEGERVLHADSVLDCTGGEYQPHWLGSSGIPAPGERALDQCQDGSLMRTIGGFLSMDPRPGERVLLVGAGHSAQTAAVALAETDARVTWVLRSSGDSIAALEDDPLPSRSALQARSRALLDGGHPRFTIRRNTTVEAIQNSGNRDGRRERDDDELTITLRSQEGESTVSVDRIVALVGSMGNQQLYRELQVQECYATAGPMRLAAALLGEAEPEGEGGADCLAQVSQGPETLLTSEPGYFILGNKSYGRNNAFLLRIGYEQVDDVMTLDLSGGSALHRI